MVKQWFVSWLLSKLVDWQVGWLARWLAKEAWLKSRLLMVNQWLTRMVDDG